MHLAYAADLAYASAQAPGGGASSVAPQLLFFAAIFAIFYFLLIRPQQRQRKTRDQMLSTLKRGDRVATTGGLHGTIVGLNEHTVVLRIADQVKVEVDRSAVGRVIGAGSEKESA